ncbi:uncharacterized protein LOC129941803 [Eupeodes corollae]|uniref:uncharacterized protein LOC129941803 n=1 Tax=Eupeodes corollae TaxID=290404 RepID=UPI0024915F3F|nr:uncharacterized protein LOC129941803 [Eupeodes corollae]
MKAIISLVCLVAIFGIVLGFSDLRDGRPGCETDRELQQVYYRNLWDANAYWVCKKKGVPATAMRCDEGGFQARLRKCVSWDDWEWEDPVAPPSIAH